MFKETKDYLKDFEKKPEEAKEIDFVKEYFQQDDFMKYKKIFLSTIIAFILNVLVIIFFKFEWINFIGSFAMAIFVGSNAFMKIKQLPLIRPKTEEMLAKLPQFDEENQKIYLNNLYQNSLKLHKTVWNDLKFGFGLLFISLLITALNF